MRMLVVGPGISLQGTMQGVERLVESTLEANMTRATELRIRDGVVKGEVEVQDTEIAGTIDGADGARHPSCARYRSRLRHCTLPPAAGGTWDPGSMRRLNTARVGAFLR